MERAFVLPAVAIFLLGIAAFAVPVQARDAVYTQGGWDAYPFCLGIFEDRYADAPGRKALVCGWDTSEARGAFTSAGHSSLADAAQGALNSCSRQYRSCVIFAQNDQVSEWAEALQSPKA